MDFITELVSRERIGLTLLLLAVLVAALALATPRDATLQEVSPIVYAHGALVWTAILAFTASGVLGALGLLTDRAMLHAWSGALARTALLFWIIYLPLGMWASQMTWNGIPLGDPRFRTAFQVVVLAGALQIATALWGGTQRRLGSALNVLMAVVLWFLTLTTQDVMHPQNPMRSSALTIQFFFALLVGASGLAALQVSRWMRHRPPPGGSEPAK